MPVIAHPSPNHGPRRGDARPDIVVLHYTAMASAEAALKRLCLPEAEVSAHYLIAEDGRTWQLVDEARRAWHAGAGAWGGVEDVNSRSVGIELANDGASPFPEPQMAALEALLPGIMARWEVPPERVIGHSCMAPGRKIDPGPRFDWRRLARQGLAVWSEGAGAPRPCPETGDAAPEAFAELMRRAGFTAAADHETLLAALRLRFRPAAEGPLGARDLALAADLAARFPVDGPPAHP